MNAIHGCLTEISILCVEDDPLSREFLARMISAGYPGWTVHTAENGQAGLDIFRKFGTDIILTDISMPVMDGIRMAREIRALNPDACIISFSAHSNLNGRTDDPDILFTRHMLKPVSRKLLYETIDECIHLISRDRHADC